MYMKGADWDCRPNAVALLGVTFPPGKKRNMPMALVGGMAPVGAAGASLFATILVQLTQWKWEFFLPQVTFHVRH